MKLSTVAKDLIVVLVAEKLPTKNYHFSGTIPAVGDTVLFFLFPAEVTISPDPSVPMDVLFTLCCEKYDHLLTQSNTANWQWSLSGEHMPMLIPACTQKLIRERCPLIKFHEGVLLDKHGLLIKD